MNDMQFSARLHRIEEEIVRYKEAVEGRGHEHTAAPEEPLIERAIRIFDELMNLDEDLRAVSLSGAPVSEAFEAYEREVLRLVTTWTEVSELLADSEGVDDTSPFYACVREAQGILTPDDEFFDHDKFIELRDAAIDEHRAGLSEDMATLMRPQGVNLELMVSRMFASVFQVFMGCSEAIQVVVRDMVDVVNDPTSTAEEQAMACATIAEALFPSRCCGPAIRAGHPVQAEVTPTGRSNSEFAGQMQRLSEAAPPFAPMLSYDSDGDCVEVLIKPDSVYAERVDARVSLYRSQETGEVIGLFVEGVAQPPKEQPDA